MALEDQIQINLDEYGQPIYRPIDFEPSSSIASKAEELKIATQEKINNLSGRATPLMSDGTAQTLGGIALNTAAGIGSGATFVASNVLQIPEFLKKSVLDPAAKAVSPYLDALASYVPEPVKQAYNAVDDALTISIPNNAFTQGITSPAKTLADAGKLAEKSWEYLYNPVMTENVQNRVTRAYDENTGFWNVVKGITEAATENPVEAGHMFVTNLPYMLALAKKGAQGVTAALGLISDNYNESLDKFKKLNGREPTEAENMRMLGTSATAALVEKAESSFILGKLRPNTLNKALDVPAKAVTGGLAEFGQEGSQSALINIGAYGDLLGNKDLQTAIQREAVIAGGVGAAAGSVGGAGVRVITPTDTSGQALKRTEKALEAFKGTQAYQPLKEVKESPAEAYRAFEKVAKDTEATSETKQSAFNNAIGALANNPTGNVPAIASGLKNLAAQADVTVSPEVSTLLDSLVPAKKESIVKKADKVYKDFRSNLADKDISPEFIKDSPEAALKLLNEKPFKATTPEELATEWEEMGKAILAINEANNDPNLVPKLISTKKALLKRKQDFEKGLLSNKDLVTQISQAKPEERSVYGSRLQILSDRLSLENVSEFTEAELTKLEQSPLVSDNQKKLIKVIRTIKSTEEVSRNIATNSDGKLVSIKDYLQNLVTAISLKDTKEASKVFNEFKTFVGKYAAKVERVNTAFAESKKTKKSIPVPKVDPKQFWTINYAVSADLVRNINRDGELIQAALLEMQDRLNPNQESQVSTKTPQKPQQEATTTSTPTTEAKVSTPVEKPVERPAEATESVVLNELDQVLERAKVLNNPKKYGLLFKVPKSEGLLAKIKKDFPELLQEIPVTTPVLTKLKGELSKVTDKSSKIIEGIIGVFNNINVSLATKYLDEEQNPLISKMIQSGVFEDGTPKYALPPEVTEVLATVGYHFIGTQAGSLMLNLKANIQRMLGMDSKEDPPNRAYGLLTFAGININRLADELGAAAYQMLGWTEKNEIERKRVQHALGFTAIKGLLDAEYLQQNNMPIDIWRELLEEVGSLDEDTPATDADRVVFVSVPLQMDGNKRKTVDNRVVVESNVQQIRDSFTDDVKKAFSDITKLESKVIQPRVTVPTEKDFPKFMRNTFQKLTTKAKETLSIINTRPYSFNTTTFQTFLDMYTNPEIKDALLASLGYESDLDKHHAVFRDGVEASNQLILKEIDDLIEFYNVLKTKYPNKRRFYFTHDIWKNSRVGLTNDYGINPQGSKIVRYLVNLDSNNVTIKPDSKTRDKDLKSIKKSIAVGFGIESGKLVENDVLIKFDALKDGKDIQAVVANPKDYAAITRVLGNYGEGTATLQALMNYVELQKQNDNVPLNFNTAIEVDGKTNGVAIAGSQFFGIASNKMNQILKVLGFFTAESDIQYLEAMGTADDMYQIVVRTWATFVNDRSRNAPKDKQSIWFAQQNYIGNLLADDGKVDKAARDLGKYPFMTTIFGKAPKNLRQDFGALLLERMYEYVEKLQDPALDEDTRETGVNELNRDIETLTGTYGGFTTENYMTYVIPKNQEELIKKTIEETYGKALSDAIEEDFKPFFQIRERMNGALNLISETFNKLVEHEANKARRPVTKEFIQELLEGKLKAFRPAIKTTYSGSIEDGFFLSKFITKRSIRAKSQVTYAKGSPIKNNPIGTTDPRYSEDTFSHGGGVLEVSLGTPGVGGLIGLIHSFDGNWMQESISQIVGFGVHDAIYLNALTAEEDSQKMNEIFRDHMYKYSIADAIAERIAELQSAISDAPADIQQFFNTTLLELNTENEKKKLLPFNSYVGMIEADRKHYLGKIKNIAQFVFHNSSVPGTFNTPIPIVDAVNESTLSANKQADISPGTTALFDFNEMSQEELNRNLRSLKCRGAK